MDVKDEVFNALKERGWSMIDDLCETFEGRVRSKTYRGGSPFFPVFEKWFRAI